MAEKIDFKKTLDIYRAKRSVFEIVDVPEMHYLMADGHGDPNVSALYSELIEALYPVAYKLKFTSKRELGKDYVVPPLEGLWWADDMDSFSTARDKSQWSWTLMLMTPDWIDWEMFEAVVDQVRAASKSRRLDWVRFDKLAEGRCVQTLHVGSFDDEAVVLERMHNEFIPANGLRMTGRHHEIYFSDFRKVDSSKLRTILRQPVTEG